MTKRFANRIAVGAVLALCTVAAACSGKIVDENDITATVKGRVVNQNGAGIENVRVRIINNLDVRDVLTDTAGAFEMKTLPAGEYALSIGKPANYALAAGQQNPRNISITAQSTNTFNFNLVPAQGSPADPAVWSVTVNDYFFYSPEITVPKGATVTWQSYGSDLHTVTTETVTGEKLDSGAMRRGQRYTHTFTNSNEVVQYHCIYHESMIGTVRVVDQ
jgi:plastocyanin